MNASIPERLMSLCAQVRDGNASPDQLRRELQAVWADGILCRLARAFYTEAPVVAEVGRRLLEVKLSSFGAVADAAWLLFLVGEDTMAQVLAARVLEHDPSDVQALKLAGRLELDGQRKLELFQRALAIDPDDTYSREFVEHLVKEDPLIKGMYHTVKLTKDAHGEYHVTPEQSDVSRPQAMDSSDRSTPGDASD